MTEFNEFVINKVITFVELTIPFIVVIFIMKLTYRMFFAENSTPASVEIKTNESNEMLLKESIHKIRYAILKEGMLKSDVQRNKLEELDKRYQKISASINNLYGVNNEYLKQIEGYFEVACYHEYDSINKVLELIQRGIPVTHQNVLPLLITIADGLEVQYERFVNLSTEEITVETIMLKELQLREEINQKNTF